MKTDSQTVYYGTTERFSHVTFYPNGVAGQVSCHECFGTGYWGYGPADETCGPCVDCKGTGLEWVGL